jgi:phospholipid-binding lipoprotein MlaA
VGDWFLNPVNYIDPKEASWAVWSFDKVNQTSYRIGDYEALKKAAIDPYVALRDVYIQFRIKKVLK